MIKYLEDFNWGNTYFSGLSILGDNIEIYFEGDSNRRIEISCEYFIGIKYLGHWEDKAIEHVEVDNIGDTLVESIFKIKKHYDLPQNVYNGKDIRENWIQLNVTLKDRSILQIACKNVKMK